MLFDLIVQIHDMQDVEELTFILMQTFYLHIENRARVNINTVVLFDIFRKADFVLILDLHKLASCTVIIYIWFQLRDLGKVGDPSVSDLICDPVSEKRISMCKETSLCDTVCLIIELLRHHLIEVFQLLMFQDFRVKLRHTVYRESCNDRHICHAHLAVHEDRHLLHFILVARIHLADFDEEPAVDLLNDLVDTRQET